MDIAVVTDNAKFDQNEIECLKGIVIRQDQEIRECKNQIEQWQMTSLKPNLIITGIQVQQNENCEQLIQTFFKHTLEIQQEIRIANAYRFKGSRKY